MRYECAECPRFTVLHGELAAAERRAAAAGWKLYVVGRAGSHRGHLCPEHAA